MNCPEYIFHNWTQLSIISPSILVYLRSTVFEVGFFLAQSCTHRLQISPWNKWLIDNYYLIIEFDLLKEMLWKLWNTFLEFVLFVNSCWLGYNCVTFPFILVAKVSTTALSLLSFIVLCINFTLTFLLNLICIGSSYPLELPSLFCLNFLVS